MQHYSVIRLQVPQIQIATTAIIIHVLEATIPLLLLHFELNSVSTLAVNMTMPSWVKKICKQKLYPGVLTIYMENPEIPVGKSNGTHHSFGVLLKFA